MDVADNDDVASVYFDFSPLQCAQEELVSSLGQTSESRHADLTKISCHIDRFTKPKTKLVVPEFGADLQWLNTSRPLTLHGDLQGRVVVLDFFTYCCVNCMHILPDLERLEKSFSNRGVVVVGVHSAKFDNEKVLGNVMNAVMRYNIGHPVVNDWNGAMWSLLSIICWPTLLILSPSAEVLLVLMGEGDCNLRLLVEGVVEHYEAAKQIDQKDELPLRLLRMNLPKSPLLFPGKIACCPDDKTGDLCVADSGHNRILILSSDGILKEKIGCGDAGFVDGQFDVAKFHSPQGVTWKSSDFIYVADTENHAIREIDLLARTVRTVAGNGKQGTDLEGGKVGSEQEICSPWDLCFARWNNSDGEQEELLVIAMAGTHQIWGLALDAVTLPSGSILKQGGCKRLVGSGTEANRNNIYPHMASFAQPSGICFAQMLEGDSKLIVADSESSAIRSINLKNLATIGVVGGACDPMDLFGFGDEDGSGMSVKLQHPLAVSYSSRENLVYVADSYNHKIKQVQAEIKLCSTLHLKSDGPTGFNEPGGICLSNDMESLYVADTNNHCIKVVDLTRNTVNPLLINFDDNSIYDVTDNLTFAETCRRKPHAVVQVPALTGRKLFLTVLGTEDCKLNLQAPNSWRIFLSDGIKADRSSGSVVKIDERFRLCDLILSSTGHVELEITLYICDAAGCCHVRTTVFQIPIDVLSTQLGEEHDLSYELNL